MKLTLDSDGLGQIPARFGRRGLTFSLLSGTACFGFEHDVAASGEKAGIPLDAGSIVQVYSGERGINPFSSAIYFAGSAGAEIAFTEIPAALPPPDPEPVPEEEPEENP